jgi:tetratricopeptide (TPR) repeat protein
MPAMTQVPIEQALHIAIAHHQAGRLAEAESIYRQILSVRPDHAEAVYFLGVLASQTGRLDQAIACYQHAIAIKPQYPQAHSDLGIALHKRGQLDQAIASFRQAVAIAPDYAQGHCNLGNTLMDKGQVDQAIECYERALALKPDLAEAHSNLGVAWNLKDRPDKAIACYHKAIALRPDDADAHYNLGNVLLDMDQLDQAVASYRSAVFLRPHHAKAHINLGNAHVKLRQLDDAAACYRRALEYGPDLDDAHLNLAQVLLATGNFAQGWSEWEWRWRSADFRAQRAFAQPRWDGSDYSGKTILLTTEQGYGDSIQFIRYAPLLAARCRRVVLGCRKELHLLLRGVQGIAESFVLGDPLPPFDAHTAVASLPGIFATTLDSIPARVPYIEPEPARVADWSAKLPPDGRFKIGLLWSGSAAPRKDNRPAPLSAFAPLAAIPGIAFHSLQIGPPAQQAKSAPEGMNVVDHSTELHDFADTAALIANLDLVISIDSAVAHLAGAMAKPCWTLLPFVADWRWFLNRSDSPWYPTMRLFRQGAIGDWTDVMNQVADELRRWTLEHRPRTHTSVGISLYQAGQIDSAITCFKQAVSVESNSAEAHNNLGNAWRTRGELDKAVDCYRRALALAPDLAEAHLNLANTLSDKGQLDNAIASYERSLSLKPGLVQAHVNLGIAWRDKCQLDKAIACYQRALELSPDSVDVHVKLAHALLAAGRLEEGWSQYEWRWKSQALQPRGQLSRPMWDGAFRRDDTILLTTDQGFGDAIQFIRYAPLVADRCKRVLLQCPAELMPLLDGVPGLSQLIPQTSPPPPFDVHCPLLRLPGLFATTLDSIPNRVPYLSPDPARAAAWAARLANDRRRRIGLVWSGNPAHKNDHNRSIPLAALAPLANVPGILLVSLQKSPASQQAVAPPPQIQLLDCTADLHDFADTAALVANLDLVISVDTAIVHLAGALAKPVWTLLPFCPDWRWLLDRCDSPWYPTMRLFRQPAIGDWTSVVQLLAAELAKFSR